MKIFSVLILFIFSVFFSFCKEENSSQISCKMQKCKIDSHIHLESGMTREMALKLIQKYEPENSISTVEDLRKKLNFTNFQEFHEKYNWMLSFLREKEDFYNITINLLKNLADRGVIYVEINYLYKISDNSTITTFEMTKTIISAMKKGKELYKIDSNLLIEFPRRIHEEQFYIGVLDEVKDFISLPENGLIGMSIVGLYYKKSSHKYINLVNHARSLGLKIKINTGDSIHTKEIWSIIKYLNPDRIGHAINVNRDFDLLNHLKETALPMEFCVTSNLIDYPLHIPINFHPIKYYYDIGLKVIFGSGHALFYDSYVDQQMTLLIETFGFSNFDIEKMFENALDSSFIKNEDKTKIREYCDAICGEIDFLNDCPQRGFPFWQITKKILFFN